MTTAERVAALESRINVREVDHRAGIGMEVKLLWDAETHEVFVSVVERDGVVFGFQVPPSAALDAFHHPYVYAPDGLILSARSTCRRRARMRDRSVGARHADAPSWRER
jgi:hypothetical protein